MYKIASDKRQAALFRGRQSDWIDGEENLSEADRLKQLQEGTRILEGRIKTATSKAERKMLGLEKLDLQNKLKAIKDQRAKSPPNWKEHFVNEAKRILSESQFRMIEAAAKHEAAREEQRNVANNSKP